MDADQVFSYLTVKGIPLEVAEILRGKNCSHMFILVVVGVSLPDNVTNYGLFNKARRDTQPAITGLYLLM